MSKVFEFFVTAILAGLAVVAGVLLLALITTIPVWLLWNWLMPFIFGLPQVTIFQAWGLMVLCGLLFKSSNSSS